MTYEQVIRFLQEHMPLAYDDEIDQSQFDQLGECIEYFETHNDPRCILPFLLVMGYGTGGGTYQTIEGIVSQFPNAELVPALFTAFASPHPGTRTWAIGVSVVCSDRRMLPIYAKSLTSDYPPERRNAADAISFIASASDREWLIKAAERESDATTKEVLSSIVRSLPDSE